MRHDERIQKLQLKTTTTKKQNQIREEENKRKKKTQRKSRNLLRTERQKSRKKKRDRECVCMLMCSVHVICEFNGHCHWQIYLFPFNFALLSSSFYSYYLFVHFWNKTITTYTLKPTVEVSEGQIFWKLIRAEKISTIYI